LQLQALGYVGIRANDLEEWATYGTRFLGMELVEKSRGTLAASHGRPQAARHRPRRRGRRSSFYGWEVADARRARRFHGASGKIPE